MKYSKIYRQAAKRLKTEYTDRDYIFQNCAYFSCHAIEDVCDANKIKWEETKRVLELYATLFKPEDRDVGDGWFGYFKNKENQESRRFSLLLMAEIAKDLEKSGELK